MGDRGNIKIQESTGNNIYVYAHWHGSDFPEMLRDALIFCKGRWDDESYFQRCIITEICKSAKDATGFGVSTYPTDNEHDVLEVESAAKKVRLLDCAGFHNEGKNWEKDCRKVLKEWSFEEYCALEIAGFQSLLREVAA